MNEPKVMTVNELILELSKAPPTAPVRAVLADGVTAVISQVYSQDDEEFNQDPAFMVACTTGKDPSMTTADVIQHLSYAPGGGAIEVWIQVDDGDEVNPGRHEGVTG